DDSLLTKGDTRVRIENGELLSGIVDKRTVGSAQGSLFHVIWVQEGPLRCEQFFTECQKLINYWLMQHSFSVGIGDGIASTETLLEIEKTIASAKKQVNSLIKQA